MKSNQIHRSSSKEEEVIKDLSQLYCPSRAEKTNRTIFWLPATDEQIEANESRLSRGVSSVVPNTDFFKVFPELMRNR